VQLRIKGTISQISLYNIKTDISGACLSPVYIEDTQARFIKLRLLEWHESPATAPDLPARGARVIRATFGRGVGAAGANDRAGAARWAAAQDRNAGGDERHSLFAAHRLPLAKANPRAGC
jgi:hypothetical protein